MPPAFGPSDASQLKRLNAAVARARRFRVLLNER
jgi:hypothetical protein